MTVQEAAKLLAILAAVDRREIDATTAQGWAWALPDVPYDRALAAAQRAYDAGVAYVDVNALKTQLRRMQPDLERDVRSAKARGLVPATWPKDQPIPPDVEGRLRALQRAEFDATNDDPDDYAPQIGGRRRVNLGAIGRNLDGQEQAS